MSGQYLLSKLRSVMITLLVLLWAGVLWGQGNSETALQWAKEVQERHTPDLLGVSGVVGTAIGSGQGAQPVVLVLLEYGGIKGLPGSLEGIPVRPMVTGRIYALGKPTGTPGGGHGGGDSGPSLDPTSLWPRPVPIGVSTGHPAITAGTISCRITDGHNTFVLSNNHVYAHENLASLGDAVIQPGTYDGGISPDDNIGTLYDFEPIDFSASANNEIDAAIALTSTDDVGNATPSDGYGMPKSQVAVPVLNMPVKKYGRTTGLTKGKIYALNATVDIGYSTGTAHFVHQIIITPGSFSAGGDSGSLVVGDSKGKNKTDDRKPVGLLFAGSSVVTIANPIDAVMNRFGVVIDGE